MSKKIGLWLLGSSIAVAIALGIGGFFFSDKKDSEDRGEEEIEQAVSLVEMDGEKAAFYGVKTENCGPGALKRTLTLRGKIILQPDKLAHVFPKIAGVVREAKKNMGDPVFQGEIIGIIESREIAEAKSEYLASIEKEKLASSLYEREMRLYEMKISSLEEFLKAKFSFEEAKINLNLAKQKLFAFGLEEEEVSQMRNPDGVDIRLYEIRAPIDGIVIARHMTQGEYVEDKTLVYEIADLNRVWVEMGVCPKDFEYVKKGQKIEIAQLKQHPSAQGDIIYVSPLIEEETIVAKAIAELENSKGEWRPGTFVKAHLALEPLSVPLLIVQSAVQMIEGEPFIFVQTENGFQKTPIQLGQSDGEYIEVTGGVKAGTPYATKKTFLLKADLGKGSVEHEH